VTDHVELVGKVVEISRDKFIVQVDKTQTKVAAQLSGKMRMNKIRVILHDKVRVKVSAYDTSHGFIVSRE
jgi:translation initiation factor IF-1